MKGTEQITPLMARDRNKSEGYMSNMLTLEDLTSLAMRRHRASDAVCILGDVLFAVAELRAFRSYISEPLVYRV